MSGYPIKRSYIGCVMVLVLLLSSLQVFAGGTQPAAQAEKPTITFMFEFGSRTEWSEDTYMIQEIGEKIDAVIKPVDGSKEKLQAMIASKDLPDFMYGMISRLEAMDFGTKGVFFPLDTKFDKTPNINKWRKTYPEWNAILTASDGHQYCTPWVSEFPYFFYAPHLSPLIRNYGIDPRKDIETFEDLYEIFKTFKKDYPDSYPWVTRRALTRHLYIFGTMGSSEGSFYPKGGKYVFAPMDENYRLMVEYMKRCYSEGLMHPDFFTMNEDPWREAMATEKAFFTVDQFRQRMGYGSADPEDESTWWISFIVPKFKGKRYYTSNDFGYVDNSSRYYASAGTEHIDKIMQYIDWQYTEEGSLWAMFGTLGETSEKTAEGYVRWKVPEGEDLLTWSWSKGFYQFRNALQTEAVFFNPERIAQQGGQSNLDLWMDDLTYFKESGTVMPPVPVLTFTDDEYEKVKQFETDIKTYAEENIVQFIRGVKPLSEWNDYVNELKKLGIEELLEVYQAAYDRFTALMKK